MFSKLFFKKNKFLVFIFSIIILISSFNFSFGQLSTADNPKVLPDIVIQGKSQSATNPLPDLKDIGGFLKNFNDNIVQNLVVLLSGVAVVLFLYGLVRFIFHRSQGSEASKLKDDKKNMLWGLAAVFVLVTLWGIINMVQDIVGVDKNNNIQIPKICVNDNCDTTPSLPGTGGGVVNTGEGCATGFELDSSTKKCIPISSDKGKTNYTGDYTANSILNWSLAMSEGSSGEAVAELQKFLKDYGFVATLNIDGIYGPATTAAVKAFQLASKLIPDGIIGPSTRAVIVYRYLQANPPNNLSYISNWPDLQKYDSGEPVRELQALLKQKGCYLSGANSSADSDFGNSTDDAVANYQAKNALKEDHIVGPSTRAVLMASDTNNC